MIGGNQLRFQRGSLSCLDFPVSRCIGSLRIWAEIGLPRLCRKATTRLFISSSIITGHLARHSRKPISAKPTSKPPTDLMSGQYSDPVRVVAFNTAEHWAEDVSEDIAREIQRRIDLAGDELPFSIEAFIEMHAGPSRQLSWRLL